MTNKPAALLGVNFVGIPVSVKTSQIKGRDQPTPHQHLFDIGKVLQGIHSTSARYRGCLAFLSPEVTARPLLSSPKRALAPPAMAGFAGALGAAWNRGRRGKRVGGAYEKAWNARRPHTLPGLNQQKQ